MFKRGAIGEDVYVAGGRVDLKGDIEGDAIVAGGHLKIGEEIRGDATLAGGIVTLTGHVSDDVRVVGGDIDIDAVIRDDLVAIGGNVIIQQNSRVEGKAWIAAGDVDVLGEIGQDLEIVGGTVTLGGRVGGDAKIGAGRLEILPTARIEGDLSYTSGEEAVISEGAVIGGSTTRDLSGDEFEDTWYEKGGGLGATLLWVIGLTVTGMVLLLAFPNLLEEVIAQLQATPWKSLGLGFVTLVVTPVLAVFCMILVIGAPLGLVLIAAYLIALLIAYLTTAIWLGNLGLDLIGRKSPETWPWRTGALLAALLALTLIGVVPLIGGLILFLAVIGGLGAWAVVIAGRSRAT